MKTVVPIDKVDGIVIGLVSAISLYNDIINIPCVIKRFILSHCINNLSILLQYTVFVLVASAHRWRRRQCSRYTGWSARLQTPHGTKSSSFAPSSSAAPTRATARAPLSPPTCNMLCTYHSMQESVPIIM